MTYNAEKKYSESGIAESSCKGFIHDKSLWYIKTSYPGIVNFQESNLTIVCKLIAAMQMLFYKMKID